MTKPEEVASKALVFVAEARALTIQTDDDYLKAQAMWMELRQQMKNLDAAYDEIIKAAHGTWKAALAKKASFYDKVEDGAKFLKQIMGAYDDKKKKERAAEEARLRAVALKEEEDRKLQEAINAPVAEQESILAEPIVIAPIVVPDTTPKVKGGPVFREVWSAEVTSLIDLVQSVAKGDTSINAVQANTVYLNQRAISDKAELRIPGVRAVSKRV
jgi:hypothetical protein